MTHLDYKPVKRAFVIRRLVAPLLIAGVLSLAIVVVALELNLQILWGLVVVFVAVGILILNALTAYRKQSYSLQERAILYTTGSLVSDRETELKYRNITHVRLIKPFIEYKLFGTGRILIEAAGSSGSEIIMESVDQPDDVYKQIQATMAEKDFSLQYGRLLSKEQPAKIAVVLEVLGGLAGATLTLALLAPGFIGAPLVLLDILPGVVLSLIASLVGLLVVGGGGFYVYALYQDLLRRTYYIYDDVICYQRGFLTRQEAFIPVENLSDAELTQNFLDKVLNLYDVVVSCQGSGSEIPFRNLKNGREVESIIDGLINDVDPLAEAGEPSEPASVSNVSKPAEPETSFTASDMQASYSMNMRRTLFKYAFLLPFFILFPPLIVLPIYGFVTVKQTQFKLTAKGVASHFSFLTTKNIEFTSDKIMAVIIKRNLIDRWFATCTVEFWSIGSTSAVTFRHINDVDGLDRTMMAKAGIQDDEELELFQPQFNFSEMVKANLYTNTPVALVFIAVVVASYWRLAFLLIAAVIFAGYGLTVLVLGRRYRRARLRYGSTSVSYKVGWLREVRHYVLYGNVKDATITAYPFSRKGTIRFNIAGEQAVQTGNSGVQYRPNSFSVKYVQNADNQSHIHDHILDQLLYNESIGEQRRQLSSTLRSSTIIRRSQPSLKNPILVATAIHTVLLPTVVLLPITVLIIRFWVRRISYTIERDYRTVKRYGVLYRTQTSIIFPKIDYIKQGQGFLNKLCRNGNIYLYTTGSRAAELTFSNLSDYKEFHQELKRQYER